MSTAPRDSSGEKPLRVRRGRVDSVDLYETKDSELDLLEKGSPAGLYLNFAIFLFSIAFSSLAALSTTTFKYSLAKLVFVVVTVVGFPAGALLLFLWNRGRQDIAAVFKEIRNRIPPDIAIPPPSGTSTGAPTEDDAQPAEPKG